MDRMRIGLAFDLKDDFADLAGRPDDWQEEFDSPVTLRALRSALEDLGHEVVELGNNRNLVAKLLADPPDLVFNVAEGTGTSRSREARVPAVCELLGVPCTGSDPATLAVALDKDWTRKLVREAGVAVPAGGVAQPGGELPRGLKFPVILKPCWEGSSKGIRHRCLVRTPGELPEVIDSLRRDYQQPLLIEEFIAGAEVTVGVLVCDGRPRVLGAMHIRPLQPTEHFVYSLEVKRDFRRRVAYELVAGGTVQWPWNVVDSLHDAALTAFQTLGCRDVARLDFRVRDGVPYFLEANPLPGLNPESSDLVILAGLLGMSHAELLQSILRATLDRIAAARD